MRRPGRRSSSAMYSALPSALSVPSALRMAVKPSRRWDRVSEGARNLRQDRARPDRLPRTSSHPPGWVCTLEPWPVFGPRNEPRANGIGADIAHARDQMGVVHRDRRRNGSRRLPRRVTWWGLWRESSPGAVSQSDTPKALTPPGLLRPPTEFPLELPSNGWQKRRATLFPRDQEGRSQDV